MSSEMLPPLFQIFTGLSFFTLLIIGTLGRPALKPLWGRIAAFSLIFVALGNFLMSQATRRSLSAGVELFAAAGASFVVAAVLVATGLFMAARNADRVGQS